MKKIPSLLLTSFEKPGRSTCFCVKIVDMDGNAYGFTNLDDTITFTDEEHTVTYDPTQELSPQNIQNSSVFSDEDNTELHGHFEEAVENLMLAGKFRGAMVTIYRVSYLQLSLGFEFVAYGTLGKIEYDANSAGKRKLEWFGIDYQLKIKQCDVFSVTCRNQFGDESCGMPFVWEDGVIAEVADPLMQFRVTGIVRPDNWFTLGVIQFVDGDNQEGEWEIESWTDDGWITMSFPVAYGVAVNTNVRLRQDCDKTATSCKNYGNILNMDAEHLTPVADTSLMIPGAYIRSSNAV